MSEGIYTHGGALSKFLLYEVVGEGIPYTFHVILGGEGGDAFFLSTLVCPSVSFYKCNGQELSGAFWWDPERKTLNEQYHLQVYDGVPDGRSHQPCIKVRSLSIVFIT